MTNIKISKDRMRLPIKHGKSSLVILFLQFPKTPHKLQQKNIKEINPLQRREQWVITVAKRNLQDFRRQKVDE